jgi:hypothetical protein
MIDEDDPEQLNYWDQGKCRGFSRCGTRAKSLEFGGILGIPGGGSDLVHKDPQPGGFCQCSRADGDKQYADGLKMAQYEAGQKVCVRP